MSFSFDFDQSSRTHQHATDTEFEPINIDVEPRYQNNEARYILHGEDYTLSEVIKHYLENDERVVFVGARKHHPMEKTIEIRIKVDKNMLNGKSVEVVLIDCLKDAATKAYNAYEDLRKCIPGIEDEPHVPNDDVHTGSVQGAGFAAADFDFGF